MEQLPRLVKDRSSDLAPLSGAHSALREIVAGLRSWPKALSPKFFYDEEGSKLFEQICTLDEYYPTRTEIQILRDNHRAMTDYFTSDTILVELGSGASVKTRILLDHWQSLSTYVPVDISREMLMSSSRKLAVLYPGLRVLPVCADYSRSFELPHEAQASGRRKIFFFPGSTIGNFDPTEAQRFLRHIRNITCDGPTYMIVGVDLLKDRRTLERAYNDEQGVTAAFNLNLLKRLNRDFGANFQLENFVHEAIFNRDESRVEMHLRARKANVVQIADNSIVFEAGETLHTESSYKYSIEGFRRLASRAGWMPVECWRDERNLFSIHLLRIDSMRDQES